MNVGTNWLVGPPFSGHRKNYDDELQRRRADERKNCSRRTSKQSSGEKGRGEPGYHPQPVERLGEARGGTTASISGGAAAAVVEGDGLDPVDRRRQGLRRRISPAAGAPPAWSLAGGRFFTREPLRLFFCSILDNLKICKGFLENVM